MVISPRWFDLWVEAPRNGWRSTGLLEAAIAHRGRPKKGEGKGAVGTFKRGGNPAYILARLERDGHAELVAKVRAGKQSAPEGYSGAAYLPAVGASADSCLPKLGDLGGQSYLSIRFRLGYCAPIFVIWHTKIYF